MALLNSTELRDWIRRLVWSGAAAYLMSHAGAAPIDIGTAWSIALAAMLAEDMAAERGLVFVQRIIVAVVATVPAMLVLSLLRGILD